jgi:hypothetical protein
VSFEAVAWALEAPVGGTQKVVLIGIASHADKFGDNAWPSIDTLAGYAHVTTRAVQMAINDLVKAGLLFKAVNEGGTRQTPGHMRPNLYRVNMAFKVANDPLTPVSPEQSYEPPFNHPLETHTTGEGAGERDSVVVCVDPTLPGMVCKAMKTEGIADTNPGHAVLLSLLEAGADLTEFTSAAADAVARKKGFAYALGIVSNRRAEVAEMAATGLHTGSLPSTRAKKARTKSFAEVDREAGMQRWEQMTGRIHPDRVQPCGPALATRPTLDAVDAIDATYPTTTTEGGRHGLAIESH